MKRLIQKIKAALGRRTYGGDLIMAIDLPANDDEGTSSKALLRKFAYAAVRTRRCVNDDILVIDTQIGLCFITVQTSHPMAVMRSFKTVCENMCLSQPVFAVRHNQGWRLSKATIPGVEFVINNNDKKSRLELWWSDTTPNGEVISLPQCITFVPVLAVDTREEDRELKEERAEWERRHDPSYRRPPIYFDLMEDEVCRQRKERAEADIIELEKAGPTIMDGKGIVSQA